MAAKINWSVKADGNFEKIINYLLKNWSEREVVNFVNKVDTALTSISENPNLYKASRLKPDLHKFVLAKQVSIIYKYSPTTNKILLVTFWDNRMNRKKLKF